ncbi:hypothetical protein ZOSMA_99G00170 [Zostera marina]|uniref:Histone deacetylase complex subunit SAP30 Sin3 binding domain-containing protein n=1 Tax=Zostera marina TaxID=29655 RepID=A0A0K9NJ28_ZOSMR|nr:hypothetical protein ZOSMA_99G00170 [Zostera marina]
MEGGLCSSAVLCPSSRVLSPSSRDESGDEELSVLPRHTKVIVRGNNRTKSVLVGLQGVVKKAVGLGGWHWLVLKNGVEVKLQRNALSVLEGPTGHEDENDCANSFCSSSDMEEKDTEYSSIEFQKPTKPRVRQTRPWTAAATSSKSNNRGGSSFGHGRNGSQQHPYYPYRVGEKVNLAKLGTAALWRYWKHFNLVSISPKPSKEQLAHAVQHHFLTQMKQLDEMQVIVEFIQTAKRLKTNYG